MNNVIVVSDLVSHPYDFGGGISLLHSLPQPKLLRSDKFRARSILTMLKNKK